MAVICVLTVDRLTSTALKFNLWQIAMWQELRFWGCYLHIHMRFGSLASLRIRRRMWYHNHRTSPSGVEPLNGLRFFSRVAVVPVCRTPWIYHVNNDRDIFGFRTPCDIRGGRFHSFIHALFPPRFAMDFRISLPVRTRYLVEEQRCWFLVYLLLSLP